MIILHTLQYVLIGILGFFFLYLVVLSFAALAVRKRKEFNCDHHNRFAIVVPAHNEELMISKTLYSLFAIVYPKNYFDIFVVADNCDDKTAEIARNVGATVFEREDTENKGKGYALRWFFDKITSDYNYDAVVVFDADSSVSGNFLTVMNWYLEQGSDVIQSSDLVHPRPGIWSSEITRISFTLYNYVRPMGRKALNLSMGLRGNGMCFKTDVLHKVPWDSFSLTEDTEYGLKLLLNEYRIDFAPEAQVTAKMPEKTQHAESQRERWEMGRFPLIRKYSVKLLSAAFKKKPLIYLDTLVDLLMPPLVNMFTIVLLMLLFNLLMMLIDFSTALTFAVIWGALAAMGLLHLFVGFRVASADRHLYKALWYVPKYIIWKIKVYLKIFSDGGSKDWVRTTRESGN